MLGDKGVLNSAGLVYFEISIALANGCHHTICAASPVENAHLYQFVVRVHTFIYTIGSAV